MRRALTCILVLAIMATPLVPSSILNQVTFAQDSRSATTTDYLNLRSSASTSAKILLVIPRGASVVVTGSGKSGFLPLSFQGTAGWAHQDYLSLTKSSGVASQTGTVTEPLNLRIGPSSGQRAMMVLPAGAKITVTGSSSNGYLAVTYGGYSGYAHKDWIRTSPTPPAVTPAPTAAPSKPVTSGTGKVTEGLNLRSQATTSSTVVLVMPAGANVKLTGKTSGDYLQLTYNGKSGWGHKSWIKMTGGTTPAPSKPAPAPKPNPPVTSVRGTARISEDLNLRTQATTSSSIIVVLKAGTTVQLTGDVSGLFYKLTFNGKTGWAHKDWITLVQVEVTPNNTASTTDAVVLRGGPATDYKRVLVIPSGARVTLTGQQSNGFHSVSYNGKAGWAFSTYLTLDNAGKNLPTLPPENAGAQPDLFPPITTNQGYHYTNAIVGPTRGTPQQVVEFAKRTKSLRQADVELYVYEIYRLAPQLGFDPSLLIAQSALETGYWKSKWWDERLNPAGLGINDNPSTHPYSAKFPNGTISARAQIAHMHAEVFGNGKALPKVLQGVDITYERVLQAGWAGTVVTLDDLAGTWATDPQYGWKISRVASYIFG